MMFKLLIIFTSLISLPAFAGSGTGVMNDFLSYFVVLIYSISFIVGAIYVLTIIGDLCDFEKFKQRSESPIRQLFVRALIAGVLMNPSNIINTVSSTLGYGVSANNSYCYAFASDLTKAANDASGNGSGIDWKYNTTANCFDSATSSYVERLTQKLNNSEKTRVASLLLEKFQIIVGLFQTIAIYFFFSAWFKIAQISDGKERQTTYGKQIAIIVVSCIFINLPSTIKAVDALYNVPSAESEASKQI